ncbi:MAG: DUF4167 domain-containing protein [Alphaproteobacteria bacterium]|nr:DUF4167 domain-containing protein [Alphaproteobacteria bacterium]
MKQNSNKNRSNGRHARQNNRRSNGITRNTVFDSCGPAGRIRGIAAQLIEKYTSLAKDARADDDRVLYETYMQYAEHYIRMLEIATANDAPRQQHEFVEQEVVENASDENTATLQEASEVQKEQVETNECGMLVLESDVSGAEAAAKPNTCDRVEDAEAQHDHSDKKTFSKRRVHRVKIEKQVVSDEKPVQREE